MIAERPASCYGWRLLCAFAAVVVVSFVSPAVVVADIFDGDTSSVFTTGTDPVDASCVFATDSISNADLPGGHSVTLPMTVRFRCYVYDFDRANDVIGAGRPASCATYTGFSVRLFRTSFPDGQGPFGATGCAGISFSAWSNTHEVEFDDGTGFFAGSFGLTSNQSGTFGVDYLRLTKSNGNALEMGHVSNIMVGDDVFADWWPPNNFGGIVEPEPFACEELGVTFDPSDDEVLSPGARQAVTVTLGAGATWDDVTLRFSFQWGHENTDPDQVVYGGGYTRDFTVSDVNATTRVYRVRTSVETSNYAFHVQCLGGREIVYYRRVNGGTSTSTGPGQRPCYWLIVRFDSPRLDVVQVVSVRVDSRVDESTVGGIEGIRYSRFGSFGFPVLRDADSWDPSLTFPIEDAEGITSGEFDYEGSSAETSDAGHAVVCIDALGMMFIPRPAGGNYGTGSPEPTGGVGSDPNTEDGDPVPVPGGGGGTGTGGLGGGPGTIPGGGGSGDGQGLGGGDCYGRAELSLWSPVSWVNYGVNAMRCVVLGLFIPDAGVVEAFMEDHLDPLSEQFPFVLVLDLIDFMGSFATAIENGTGESCLIDNVIPVGNNDATFCVVDPPMTLSGEAYTVAVWALIVPLYLAVMRDAWDVVSGK